MQSSPRASDSTLPRRLLIMVLKKTLGRSSAQCTLNKTRMKPSKSIQKSQIEFFVALTQVARRQISSFFCLTNVVVFVMDPEAHPVQ